jgi:hypothetical protein
VDAEGTIDVRGTTICIQEEGDAVTRKITKIQPYSKGGFAILMPYHAERRGYLAKHPVDYASREDIFLRHDVIEYSAKDRVKLSIHPDGFVQFSSESGAKIVSGRDPVTGAPKGLGLISQPLGDPIRTGPTFGATVWGLTDFEPLQSSERADAMVFSEESFYYRDCTPDRWSAYVIEGFVFPSVYWGAVRKRAGTYSLSLAQPQFEVPGAVLDFQVIPLPNQPEFLGLLVSRLGRGTPYAPSGFILNGPSEFRPADALLAIYPSPWSTPPQDDLDYGDGKGIREDLLSDDSRDDTRNRE